MDSYIAKLLISSGILGDSWIYIYEKLELIFSVYRKITLEETFKLSSYDSLHFNNLILYLKAWVIIDYISSTAHSLVPIDLADVEHFC